MMFLMDTYVGIPGHACGEYVLHQLQRGVSPERVCEELMSQFIVKTTVQRLSAYRRYREEKSILGFL